MERAYEFLRKNINFKYNEVVIVAVSGGPDSMALLNMLIELRKEYNLSIVCAHVNHNVREESEEEENYVEKFCDNNSIIFEGIKLNEYHDENFHNQARTKRYTFFEKLVKKYNSKYLFTAHHGDDLVETVLMRIVRGSTLGGYSGFSKVLLMDGYKIVRPLIYYTKDEVLKYAKKNKIKYYVDKSNSKDKYTRNRYRKYLLPFLKKEDPNVHLKFLKFSETLKEYNEYMDNHINDIINDIYIQNVLNIEKFLNLEKIVQTKIIYYILEHVYQDDLMLVNNHHVDILFDLIKSKKPNVTVHLPSGVKAVKSYSNFSLLKFNEDFKEFDFEFEKYINLPNGMNLEKVDNFTDTSNFVCRLNSNDIKMPLRVRNREKGDKMEVKGLLGRKKIKDIFIDSKIPLDKRDTWPIVVDGDNNILWLPGLKKSKFDKTKNEKCDIIIRYY